MLVSKSLYGKCLLYQPSIWTGCYVWSSRYVHIFPWVYIYIYTYIFFQILLATWRSIFIPFFFDLFFSPIFLSPLRFVHFKTPWQSGLSEDVELHGCRPWSHEANCGQETHKFRFFFLSSLTNATQLMIIILLAFRKNVERLVNFQGPLT